jgi:hypothetical protein
VGARLLQIGRQVIGSELVAAAQLLGISARTVYRKLAEMGEA